MFLPFFVKRIVEQNRKFEMEEEPRNNTSTKSMAKITRKTNQHQLEAIILMDIHTHIHTLGKTETQGKLFT